MEKQLFAMEIGDSIYVDSKCLSGNVMRFHVLRVPTGWIFESHNDRPTTVFVPLTTYTNPTV